MGRWRAATVGCVLWASVGAGCAAEAGPEPERQTSAGVPAEVAGFDAGGDLVDDADVDEAPGTTGGLVNDGCLGPALCRAYAQNSPDCDYDPVVDDPTYPFCSGSLVWVDTTHDNWHQITPESQSQPGRYWGFSKLLFADGYDVRDSDFPLDHLQPGEGPDILVIASAYRPDDEPEALTEDETRAVLAWVEAGGSLLLVFDHEPFDRVGDLLGFFGLVQVPAGADTMQARAFRRSDETLIATPAVTAGVRRVVSFRGSTFDVVEDPPSNVTITPVLRYGEDAVALVGEEWVRIDGLLAGATLTVGLGRVYVSAEAAGFSAQITQNGTRRVGMHVTAYNEQYLLNIVHWLDPND